MSELSADEVFDELVRTYERHSDLAAAYRQSEQQYERTHPEGGYLCHEVVRHAWMKLTPEQQRAEMDHLFNAWFITQMNIRKWLELDAKEPDANTYLHHGDLEIFEHIGDTIEDGMITIGAAQLQRILNEIELLRHRLKMRDTIPGRDLLDAPAVAYDPEDKNAPKDGG